MPTLSIVEATSFTSTNLNEMVVRLPFSIHHDSGKLEDNESFPLKGENVMKIPLLSISSAKFISLQEVVVIFEEGINLARGVATEVQRKLAIVGAKLSSSYRHD